MQQGWLISSDGLNVRQPRTARCDFHAHSQPPPRSARTGPGVGGDLLNALAIAMASEMWIATSLEWQAAQRTQYSLIKEY